MDGDNGRVAGLEQIILDDATLFCPDALRDVVAPRTSFSFVGAEFAGRFVVENVRCKSLNFKQSRFHQSDLVLEGLVCDTIDLRSAKLGVLAVNNCKIGALLLDGAMLTTLQIVKSEIGNTRGGTSGGIVAPWHRADQQESLSSLVIRESKVSGLFDITGRRIRTNLILSRPLRAKTWKQGAVSRYWTLMATSSTGSLNTRPAKAGAKSSI